MFTNSFVEIPNKKKYNFFKLYIFILGQIFKYLMMPLMIFIFLILILSKKINNFKLVLCLGMICVLTMVAIAFEETFHAAILIIQGRIDEVNSLQFDKVGIKKAKVCVGVSVFFKGKFTQNDVIYISLAGPIMSLLCSSIIFILYMILSILITKTIDIKLIGAIAFGLFIVPIFSLLPVNKYFIVTDGYKVWQLIKKYKISLMNVFKIIKIIINYCFKYVYRSI